MLRLISRHRASCTGSAALLIRRAPATPPGFGPRTVIFHAHLPIRQIHTQAPPNTPLNSIATDAERVMASSELQDSVVNRILHDRLSERASRSIYSLMQNAIQMATGPNGADAYRFIIDVWSAVMLNYKGDLDLLRTLLLQDTSKVIHLMINRADWGAYNTLINPFKAKFHPEQTWAHTLAEALQLRQEEGYVSHSPESMVAFLRQKSRPALEKHKLLAIYVRKMSTNPSSSHQLAETVACFLDYYERVEGRFSGFPDSLFHLYRQSLALVAVPPQGTPMARHLAVLRSILAPRGPSAAYSGFLSALMRSVARSHPHLALQYWEHKVLEADEGENQNVDNSEAISLVSADLDSAMLAHITSRNYQGAMELYSAHPGLQTDSQILLLLEISERTADWKLLQSQFESMYGRGDLPYVAHYSLVMGALASIGATGEAHKLYQQLLRRNLQPNGTIFHALIKSCINSNDYEGAERYYQIFLDMVDEKKISADAVAPVRLQFFHAHILHSSVDTAMAELEALVEKQCTSSVVFVNSDTICTMIRFLTATYSQANFEKVWSLAQDLGLLSESVRCRAIAFWTRMGHFERANELVFDAHMSSMVPFQSSAVLTAELRNYREWFRQTANGDTRQFLLDRIHSIISRAEAGTVSPKNLPQLLAEIIKHLTVFGKLDDARRFLDRAKQLNVLHESHFIPLLAEHSKEATYDGSTDVLNLYGDMVAQKISISAKTYHYLLKSLLKMNSYNKRESSNAYQLLESVFEAYGFAVVGEYKGKNVPLDEVAKNAVFLLRIVSEYAIATSANAEENIDIVVDFLNQIRTVLDRKIDFELRVSILVEMSKVYQAYGNLAVASTLADNALGELHEILDHLPKFQTRPKPLQLDYRRIVGVKLQLLDESKADASEYLALLTNSLQRHVRLSGSQFSIIFRQIAENTPLHPSTLDNLLDFTERFLVSGNWSEVAVSRKVYYIYRLYILHLSSTMSPEAIESKYSILNKFYQTENVRAVLNEYGHIHNAYHALKHEVENFHKTCSSEKWTLESFFESVPEFFVPGRSMPTKNLLRPDVASRLASEIELLCNGDQKKAFALYDKYPETIEYLLFFLGERARLAQFQNDIKAISGAVAYADRQAKRRHYIGALEHLGSHREAP